MKLLQVCKDTQIANANTKCAHQNDDDYIHIHKDKGSLTYGQRNKGEIHFLKRGKVSEVTACVGKLFQIETTL